MSESSIGMRAIAIGPWVGVRVRVRVRVEG